MCKIEGPCSAEQIASLDLATYLSRGLFSVAFSDATTFIQDQGTVVIDTLAKIPPKRTVAIMRSVSNIFYGLYAGIVAVVANRDYNNQISTDVVPPVLPHSLTVIRTNELCEIIRPHHVRLEKDGWTTQQIDQIEEDHRDLRRAVNSEAWFKKLLCRCSDFKTVFMEGWEMCQGRLDKLQLLDGGLLSIFPNTATLESDFSIIGAEKNVYRQSLTDFLLKSILHANQFKTLHSMCTE